ncbi:unnamed protein product [Closterium sp. NIES-65]|nr:unnamed protein product [Closterium sp. NIES-65]
MDAPQSLSLPLLLQPLSGDNGWVFEEGHTEKEKKSHGREQQSVNNFKSWNLPPCCVPHVTRYVSSGAYHADHSAAITAAAAFFRVPLGDGLSRAAGGWERRGGGGEEAVGVQQRSVLGRKGGEGKGVGAADRGDAEGDWVWGEGQPASRGVRGRLSWEPSRQQSQEGGSGNGKTRGGEGREEVGRWQQKRQEVVVFDIDETLLSNLPYLQAHGYGSEPYNSSQWADWVFTSAAPPLPAGIALVRALQQTTASMRDDDGVGRERHGEESRGGGLGAGGLGVALVTGRPESQRAATVENLRRVGVTQWKVLMMRPLDANGNVVQETAVQFKSRSRREIEAMGMRIVGSVGDQWSDITGDATGNGTFKLPNPFYFVP